MLAAPFAHKQLRHGGSSKERTVQVLFLSTKDEYLYYRKRLHVSASAELAANIRMLSTQPGRRSVT